MTGLLITLRGQEREPFLSRASRLAVNLAALSLAVVVSVRRAETLLCGGSSIADI